MQAHDFSPLFRSAVGFDRLARMAEAARRGGDNATAYPPYNIEKRGEDGYAITLAVAGFTAEDLSIEVTDGLLSVSGRKTAEERQHADADEDVCILHRGIAFRDFTRRFQLADHVKVDGADLDHGLLTVRLHREEPAAATPRRVPIGAAA